MNYPLSEIHANILKGQILGAPEPEKKGIFQIFNREKPQGLSGLTKEFQVLLDRQSSLASFVVGYFNDPNKYFSLSAEKLREIARSPQFKYVNVYQYDEAVERLLKAEWVAGEKWLATRHLFFLSGYFSERTEDRWLNLLKELQGDILMEGFLLLLMGMARRDTCHQALNFIVKASLFFDFKHDEITWLFDLIEKASDQDFKNTLPKVGSLCIELAQECKAIQSENQVRSLYNMLTEEFKCHSHILQLNQTELRTFWFLLRSINSNSSDFGFIYYPAQKLVAEIEAKLDLTEAEMAEQMMRCIKSKHNILVPEKIIQYISANAGSKVFQRSLFEATWDLFFHNIHHFSNKHIDKPLRKQVAQQLAVSGETLTWEALLWTGFRQVPIPTNHSPYFGLHPDQIRPLFQLMRAVANVDIVKIYKVGKLYHIRFVFGGEMYDMPTGDGFGIGPVPLLNTLLFENGVPYQLVVLEVPLFDTQLDNRYKTKIITLVNEETYQRFENLILPQGLAGFVKSGAPAPVFTQNIDELGALKARPELDVIKLEEDPKFTGIREQLEKLEPLEVWMKLLQHCLSYPLDGKPSATWQGEAKKLALEMSANLYRKGMVMVVDGMIKGEEWFSDDEKICGLRGLVWLCRVSTDGSLRFLLQRTANKAYKKVPGGPLNAKLGNLAMDSLVADGSLQAFGALGNLNAKAKYPVFVRAIASAMKKFDKLLKQFPADELQDRVIPTHELVGGERTIPVGNFSAKLRVEGLKAKLEWLGANGKTTASVPAELKREHEVDLQSIKGEVKGIEETIQAQLFRLEQTWIQNRSWQLDFWLEFYHGHELMGLLVQKLVWQVETEGKLVSFMPMSGIFYNKDWQAIQLPESGRIRLWHPALSTSVAEVDAWRTQLFAQKIVQPFKQAFREVYLLTPAEESSFDQSMRFAGHYLKGNTLYSLGKNRMWTMSYDQAPLRKIPELNLVAEMSISGVVLHNNCTTGALCFREMVAGTNAYNMYRQAKMPLKNVPPTVLSEVMRDVDLFVAVSTVGIDPYFDQNNTGDLLNYWQDVSFGEKSKTEVAEIRRDLLQRLIPMTKIASQCRFDSNYLYVKGKIREYKINLNSGNILMLPNDQYLCIVPAHDAKMEKRIWLPFEGGDAGLMLILSKAFLLADDDKITDPQILGQLKR